MVGYFVTKMDEIGKPLDSVARSVLFRQLTKHHWDTLTERLAKYGVKVKPLTDTKMDVIADSAIRRNVTPGEFENIFERAGKMWETLHNQLGVAYSIDDILYLYDSTLDIGIFPKPQEVSTLLPLQARLLYAENIANGEHAKMFKKGLAALTDALWPQQPSRAHAEKLKTLVAVPEAREYLKAMARVMTPDKIQQFMRTPFPSAEFDALMVDFWNTLGMPVNMAKLKMALETVLEKPQAAEIIKFLEVFYLLQPKGPSDAQHAYWQAMQAAAVEIAKEFGSENSFSFINGVLGTIYKEENGQ